MPLSVTDCEPPNALSATVSVAVRAPVAPAAGLKTTLMVQVPAGGNSAGVEQLSVSVKSRRIGTGNRERASDRKRCTAAVRQRNDRGGSRMCRLPQ